MDTRRHSLSGGQDYNFAHLQPTSIVFNLLGNVQLEGECRFKSHCYTRELDAGESAKGLVRIDDENGNERYFCPDRYALSLRLAGWVASWCDQKCILGKDYKHGAENWLIVEDGIKTTHPYDRSKPHEATRDNSLPFNTQR